MVSVKYKTCKYCDVMYYFVTKYNFKIQKYFEVTIFLCILYMECVYINYYNLMTTMRR